MGARSSATRTFYLTFDDGPHRLFTGRIMATLDRFGVRALFFVVGKNVKRLGAYPDELLAAGHRIGNHTYTHPRLTELETPAVEDEIRRTEALLGGRLGRDKVFRPPFGARDARVNRIIRKCGYRSVLWDVSTRDWDKAHQPKAWIDLGLSLAAERKRDSIVLMHDIQRTTAAGLPEFIERLGALDGMTFGDPKDI